MADGDFTHLNGVYKEMAELLGSAAALQIWNRYAGVIVSFPKQLYSKEHIRQYIRENSGKMKPSEIARTIGLTERRVRQIIREEKNEDQAEQGKQQCFGNKGK